MVCSKRIVLLFSLLLVLSTPLWAQDDTKGSDKGPSTLEQFQSIAELAIPSGFSEEPSEDSGVIKFKKDTGEILIVIGDLFSESSTDLMKMLKEGAEKNKNIEEVKGLEVKNGSAFFYKEKKPEDSVRLLTWRIVAITDSRVINIDFTAPAGDFEKYIKDFEDALRSFNIKSPS